MPRDGLGLRAEAVGCEVAVGAAAMAAGFFVLWSGFMAATQPSQFFQWEGSPRQRRGQPRTGMHEPSLALNAGLRGREPLVRWRRPLLHSAECNPEGWKRLHRLSALFARVNIAADIAPYSRLEIRRNRFQQRPPPSNQWFPSCRAGAIKCPGRLRALAPSRGELDPRRSVFPH